MKTLSKLVLASAVVFGLSACAASTGGETTSVKSVAKDLAVATVKPGASVTLESVLPKSMEAGSFQTVSLNFADGYADGTLSVSVVPSEGLRLFGGEASKTFNMAAAGTHSWDVDVSAETDGVYFLNVFADANGAPRSFSVRLDIGQVSQKMIDAAMPENGELTDGGKIRVLEATETIK